MAAPRGQNEAPEDVLGLLMGARPGSRLRVEAQELLGQRLDAVGRSEDGQLRGRRLRLPLLRRRVHPLLDLVPRLRGRLARAGDGERVAAGYLVVGEAAERELPGRAVEAVAQGPRLQAARLHDQVEAGAAAVGILRAHERAGGVALRLRRLRREDGEHFCRHLSPLGVTAGNESDPKRPVCTCRVVSRDILRRARTSQRFYRASADAVVEKRRLLFGCVGGGCLLTLERPEAVNRALVEWMES